MQRITSRQNAVVAAYRSAARGETPDTLLLDGAHLVDEALRAGIRLTHVLVSTAALDSPDITRILGRLDPRAVEVAEGSPTVMDAASPVRSSSQVVALAAHPTHGRTPFDAPTPLVIVACDIQDPGNLGAIARVGEAAGASGLVLAGQSADPFGWKALRGSMGSALRLPIAQARSVADAVGEARRRGVRVVATVPRGGTPLFECDLTQATALLVGGEGLGLDADVIADADVRVTIPMDVPVESLNAAVAAAVLLYEARRQRTAPTVTR